MIFLLNLSDKNLSNSHPPQVSKGEQHYAPGGAYSMFTGKDASRAFITGDFSEAGLVDDLSGLKSESFNGVKGKLFGLLSSTAVPMFGP